MGQVISWIKGAQKQAPHLRSLCLWDFQGDWWACIPRIREVCRGVNVDFEAHEIADNDDDSIDGTQ